MKIALQLILIIAVFFLGFYVHSVIDNGTGRWQNSAATEDSPREENSRLSFESTLGRVVDGDTVELADGRRIRLVGIDAPESFESQKLIGQADRLEVPVSKIAELGVQASNFLEKRIRRKEIRVELEQGVCDRYGRILAYLYMGGEGKEILLNREMLSSGYASVMKGYPFRLEQDFLAVEQKAKKEQVGLWSNPLFQALSQK